MKIDNTDFNEKHFATFSEAQFIEHELASVPDHYGSKEKKVAFLKMAYAKIKGSKPTYEKPLKVPNEITKEPA